MSHFLTAFFLYIRMLSIEIRIERKDRKWK